MNDPAETGTASSLPVDVQLPGYRLRRQVGADSIGLWFDAEQESLGRKVTVKVLKPRFADHERARAEFLKEMERLAGLDHPGLLRVIDTRTEGALALVTERIGSRTLAALLREGRGLPVDLSLHTALDVARALAYLAGEGLAHKNVSPSLIALREDGGARLVTFRNVIPLEEQAALKGKLVQDARYVAPEQLAGPEPVGPAAHVYQLGCLLFHMLAGRPPFPAGDVKELARCHLREEFPSLKRARPFLPDPIYAFVAACTQRRPDRRPALDRAADGLELLREKGDPGIGPPREERAPGKIVLRPRRRRRR